MYEYFEKLLKEKGLTAYRVSKETGVTQSTLSDWKRGRSTPKTDNMKKIADFLNVSVEYLMTGEDTPTTEVNSATELTAKDERDIARRLEKTLSDLESSQDGLMFSGEPLDDETRELLKISLENSIRIAKINAKEKFTPKKYKKE